MNLTINAHMGAIDFIVIAAYPGLHALHRLVRVAPHEVLRRLLHRRPHDDLSVLAWYYGPKAGMTAALRDPRRILEQMGGVGARPDPTPADARPDPREPRD